MVMILGDCYGDGGCGTIGCEVVMIPRDCYGDGGCGTKGCEVVMIPRDCYGGTKMENCNRKE